MTGLIVWWEGIPGLDWRYLPHDHLFGDRMAALACATRVHGTAGIPDRTVENTADAFFAWFGEADPADSRWEGYLRRLALAMACGDPDGEKRPQHLIKRAVWYLTYLRKPADRHGGWI